MAKKKAIPSRGASLAKNESKRTPLMLRIDDEVLGKIKQLADGAEISVNQLIQGLMRWAAQYGHVGEPTRDDDGILRNKRQSGCIWIGKDGWKPDELDQDEWDPEDPPTKPYKGELHLFLDYTERRVLREDIESGIEGSSNK